MRLDPIFDVHPIYRGATWPMMVRYSHTNPTPLPLRCLFAERKATIPTGGYSISARGSTSPSRSNRATSISEVRLWPSSVRFPTGASER